VKLAGGTYVLARFADNLLSDFQAPGQWSEWLTLSERCDILSTGERLLEKNTGRENWRAQASPASTGLPETEGERAAVREQLERILASSCFRNSRKYPAFLRYIVEHALNGETEHLKERTLGVEVFGRHPEYDTSADPVVRIVAAEVRKRIGQYYHELAAPGEVVLDLHAGAYVPSFSIPERAAELHPVAEPLAVEPARAAEAVAELPLATQPVVVRSRLRGVHRRAWYAAATLSLILFVGAGIWLTQRRATVMDQFWRPIVDSPGDVLLVVGGGASWIPQASGTAAESPAANPPVSIDDQQSRDVIALSDATTLAGVAGILRSYRKAYLIRPYILMDLPQLRTEPAVLIGAFNNPWTLRLTANLRFHFIGGLTTTSRWLADRKNPDMKNWKVDSSRPYSVVTDDWAMISRFRDPETEHWIVAAAGLSRFGTIAAGEFLTNPIHLEELARRAPANWGRKNLQVIIATTVINGQPAPPRILATEFW
jgi:hypothetical protein